MSPDLEPLRVHDRVELQDSPGVATQVGALWRGAPAWRLLAVSTGALALVAVAMPLVIDRAGDGVRTVEGARVAGVAASDPAPARSALAATIPAADAPVAPSTPAEAAPTCTLRPIRGASGEGVVLGFLSPDAAASLLSQTEAQVGARINPAFLANQRAVIGVGTPTAGRRVVALVPKGMTVARGERVLFAAGHRDATLPCAYVPNLISGRATGD